METVYKHYKNSNTGDLIMSQEFINSGIKDMPIYWYRNNKSIDNPDLKGYVEMSEKKWERLVKKSKRVINEK